MPANSINLSFAVLLQSGHGAFHLLLDDDDARIYNHHVARTLAFSLRPSAQPIPVNAFLPSARLDLDPPQSVRRQGTDPVT